MQKHNFFNFILYEFAAFQNFLQTKQAYNIYQQFVLLIVSLSCVQLLDLFGLQPPNRLLCLWDFSGKMPEASCHIPPLEGFLEHLRNAYSNYLYSIHSFQQQQFSKVQNFKIILVSVEITPEQLLNSEIILNIFVTTYFAGQLYRPCSGNFSPMCSKKATRNQQAHNAY